ncbi:MAG: hypothetical protein J5957_10365 [Prevotella sp.]|nr:hypothetical protein [Prevotella sp.]
MKHFKIFMLVGCAFFGLSLTGCNTTPSNNTGNQVEGETNNNEEYSYPQEDEGSQYILSPSALYEGSFEGGFSSGFLTTATKNNETTIQIKAYKDGGITFGFDNKVYVKGWGWNMSGELEGQWEAKSFSYHDVEYNVMVIKCKQSIYPTYYEDSNHTPKDFRHIETLTVEMIVDQDLNFYFTENALINHTATGKLVKK